MDLASDKLKIVSIIFLCIFGFKLIHHSLKYSMYSSLLLWASVVVATPLPSASILFSFPLKVYFNIPMHITQIVASIIALVLIHFINPVYLPGFVKLLIKKHLYYITVIFCIISSVILSKVLDTLLTEYLGSKKEQKGAKRSDAVKPFRDL